MTVVTEARRAAQEALRPRPAAERRPAPERGTGADASAQERREKILRALRRLHPMD